MNSKNHEHLNLLGERFGQLTVIKELPFRINKFGKREYMWLCQCDCGNTIEECTHNLRQGCATRCQKCYIESKGLEYNGRSPKGLYGIWAGMKSRCYNPNNPYYHIYGAKGIRVCDEWNNSFIAFREWAFANGYIEETNHLLNCSIDRIDPTGNYEPENCRWATISEQAYNKRNTRKYEIFGKIYTLKEIEETFHIGKKTFVARVSRFNRTPEEAIVNYNLQTKQPITKPS